MKKLFSCLAVCSLLIMQGIPVFADQRNLDVYHVAVPTYAVTTVETTAAQIDGYAKIHKIVITNSDVSEPQNITFYSESDSTTTVTSEFVVNLPSTTTNTEGLFQMDFPIPASPWYVNDLCVRKSSLNSTVNVTIFYR